MKIKGKVTWNAMSDFEIEVPDNTKTDTRTIMHHINANSFRGIVEKTTDFKDFVSIDIPGHGCFKCDNGTFSDYPERKLTAKEWCRLSMIDNAPIWCLVQVCHPNLAATKIIAVCDSNGEPMSYCGPSRRAALCKALNRLEVTDQEIIDHTMPFSLVGAIVN